MRIVQEIKEEIKGIYKEPSSRDLTILAVIFLVILSLIGAYYLFWKSSDSGYYWIGGGVFLAALRLIPPVFRRVYKLWLYFSVVLGYFVSRMLLTLVFFLAITPTGFIMRIVGKDPMERKLDPNAPSYWIPRSKEEDRSFKTYERQF